MVCENIGTMFYVEIESKQVLTIARIHAQFGSSMVELVKSMAVNMCRTFIGATRVYSP